MFERIGQSRTIHDCQVSFFQANPEQVKQILHHGPIHVERDNPEPMAWRFAITIPHNPGIDTARTYGVREGTEQRASGIPSLSPQDSYLPLNPDQIKQHTLPPTCSITSDSDASNAYVKYWQEAVLDLGYQQVVCSLPITVQAPSELPPILDWNLQVDQFRNTIVSYHLIPGMEATKLSFRQSAKQLFKMSSVPMYSYRVELSVPTVMQLDHPSWIPIKFRVTPQRDKKSSILHDVPQKVVLNWVRMKVKSKISNGADDRFKMFTRSYDLGLERVFSWLLEPIVFTADENAEPVDFGEVIQLRLCRTGLLFGTKKIPSEFKTQVSPSFTTYNIKHAHRFVYKCNITIAGKEHSIRCEVPATVIAPYKDALAYSPSPQVEHTLSHLTEPPPLAFKDVVGADSGPGCGRYKGAP